MHNTLTVAEIKRRGMAAIEDGLRHGPVRIIKRNKPAAVVLSAEEYERLSSDHDTSLPGMSAMQWLLDHPPKGTMSKHDIDRHLDEERNW